MDWKQPEGLRRHWTLEELDAELLFLHTPANAAQGRVGDDVYDLRDGGHLRKRRALLFDGNEIAVLEEKAAGAGGVLTIAGREYTWKPANVLGTKWSLEDANRTPVFTYTLKPGLAKVARLELDPSAPEDAGVLVLLTWYVTVL